MTSQHLRVLIVDDFELVRFMVRGALLTIGYNEIDEARDGKEALDALHRGLTQKRPYTLVISDLYMPEMDGLELLRQCRADAALKDLPIVMLTAEVEKKVAATAMAAGANGYLVKPVDPTVLLQKIKEILGGLKPMASGG